MHVTARRAEPDDLHQISNMFAGLTQHHGDTPRVMREPSRRGLFGLTPWVTVFVAQGPHASGLSDAALNCVGQLQFSRRFWGYAPPFRAR